MIEQITIENFKSIGRVTVDLSPVTVLIGRSGVGKSNFLRAIRFLRNYLIAPNIALEKEGGWYQVWPFGLPGEVSISLRFSLPGFEKAFEYRIGWGRHSVIANQPPVGRVESEKLVVGTDVVFAWNQQAWLVWPGEGTAPKAVPTELNLGRFPTVSEAVVAYTALTNGVGWYDFPATVFGPGSTQAANGSTAFGLNDDAANYLVTVQALIQDLRDQASRRTILARLQQINPSIRSVELDSVHNPRKVVVGHEFGGQKRALDLSQESDGFRRYYAHLLALYQTPPKQVLMFEEPENGVYPGALRNLSEEFNTAARGRSQIILSTQSPEFLNGFAPEQLRVVDLDPVNQQTIIGPLDAGQVESVRTQLLYPGELLTVDEARVAVPAT